MKPLQNHAMGDNTVLHQWCKVIDYAQNNTSLKVPQIVPL